MLLAIEVEAKSDLDASQSYDIVSEMEMIGAHRRRSNTAQRLEKLKQEKKIQSKVKVIQWNNDDVNLAGWMICYLLIKMWLKCFT